MIRLRPGKEKSFAWAALGQTWVRKGLGRGSPVCPHALLAELWARPFRASVFPLTPKQPNPSKSRLAEKSPCKAARHTSLLA